VNKDTDVAYTNNPPYNATVAYTNNPPYNATAGSAKFATICQGCC